MSGSATISTGVDAIDALLAFQGRHGLGHAETARLLKMAGDGGRVTVSRWAHRRQSPPPYLTLALERLDGLGAPELRRRLEEGWP